MVYELQGVMKWGDKVIITVEDKGRHVPLFVLDQDQKPTLRTEGHTIWVRIIRMADDSWPAYDRAWREWSVSMPRIAGREPVAPYNFEDYIQIPVEVLSACQGDDIITAFVLHTLGRAGVNLASLSG